jgi:hypothetical protein
MNNQKYYFPAFICLLFALHSLEAQSFEPLSIAGIVDGKNLTNPFSGGSTAPNSTASILTMTGRMNFASLTEPARSFYPSFGKMAAGSTNPTGPPYSLKCKVG